MRHVLTALGILIIVAIVAAMGVPHFVDFARYRSVFEAQIAEMTGHPVRIEGTIKLRLLPTPSLSMRQVRLGPADEKGFRMFEAERIAGALAPMPLLRGDFQITEAFVDSPILRVGDSGVDSLIGSKKGAAGARPDAVSIEKLHITDGTAIIQRKGREPLTISEYTGEIEANSLLGPAKGNGEFVVDGAKRHVRFAVGKIEAGKTRVKALLEDAQLALRLDVDGVAGVGSDASERFDGTIALVGNTALGVQEKVQLPLRFTARARVSGPLLMLEDLAIVAGQEPQPLTLAGRGTVQLEARPVYDITLAARSYDFDRPGPDGKPRRAVPAELIRQAAALMPQGGVDAPDVEGKLDLSAGALILSGQTVTSPHVVLEQRRSGMRVQRLEGELPGQSRVQFTRGGADAPGLLSGEFSFQSRDPERLHGWFNGIQRTMTAAAAIDAVATVSSITDGVRIENMEIRRGETVFQGDGRYLLPRSGVRPTSQLQLTMRSARLHVVDIPAFVFNTERREEKPELDFDLDIRAERLALNGRDTGRLAAKLRRDGDIVSVERVEILGLDGANLIASGSLGGGARRVTFKLDAEKADGIAAILAQVIPGPFFEGLVRRAEALSPGLLVASLANNEADDSFDLDATGALGGTEIKASGKLIAKADIGVDLTISGDNPDSGRLARQLSGTARGVVSALPGAMRLSVKGNPRATMDVAFVGTLLGINADLRGAIKLFQPFIPFEGTLGARTTDTFPVLAALGFEPQFLTQGVRGSLTAKVQSNLQKITVTDMRAQFGEMPVTGEIAFKMAEGGAIAGQLKLPQIDLGAALALSLVPPRPGMTAAGWSAATLGKPMALPLFGDLWIEAGKARVDEALAFDDARFVLRFADGLTSFEHSSFRYGPMRLGGDLTLRRAGANATLTTKLTFADLDAERLFRGGLKGFGEGEFQGAGSGPSLAKIAQTLAGSGQLRLKSLVIPAMDGRGLARLLETPPLALGPLDAANLARRLEAELAKGPLAAPDLRLPLVAIDGALRLGPVTFETIEARHELAGSYDLARLAGDFRLTTSASRPPAQFSGMAPQFTAQWRGPLAALQPSLSVDQIVNSYLAWTLKRDAERNEILEQDLRERAYFNRRLKAMEWEQRRMEDARVEALRVEQERKAEEERQRRQKAADEQARRLVEDAARKNAETARKAAEDAAKRQAEEAARRAAPLPLPLPQAPGLDEPVDLRPPG